MRAVRLRISEQKKREITGNGGWKTGDGKWGMEKAERECVRGAPFSFLESSQGIRLLGAFKATPAPPVLARFARQQP